MISTTSATRSTQTAEEALAVILSDLLHKGEDVTISDHLSIGSGRKTKELTNYLIGIDHPKEKLILNPARRLRPSLAVARFIWMMAGNDRVADISFYDDRAEWFSDDGFSIPGSNFGQRILRPQPGINQLSATVDLLRRSPATRRAVMSIYQPGDCGRNSRDIPCALSLGFHIRDGVLASTILMRSNNAFSLFPHNIFEFSLLAEVIAAEIGIPLGPLSYFALSMHLYEEDFSAAERVISLNTKAYRDSPSFPELPRDPGPLAQLGELSRLERELRFSYRELRGDSVISWISKSADRLDAYWHQYFLVLLFWALGRAENQSACAHVESILQDPWKALIANERPALSRTAQNEDHTLL